MSEQNLQLTKQLFADVRKNLEVNKSLPWSLSGDALNAAVPFLASPEVQLFMDEYLLRIISLMTQQSPSKLGAFEKNILEESMIISMKIILKLVGKIPKLLAVLARIFDPSIPFYSGSKIGYSFSPGYPVVRLQMARKFAEAKGFNVLMDAMRAPQFPWPGGDVLLNILRTIQNAEINALVDDAVKDGITSIIMVKMLALPDEQIKKENTDTIATLINTIATICSSLSSKGPSPLNLNGFYSFWFENTLKFMKSSSLVLKLFAWEQLNEMIQEARVTRPLASTYIVEGCGTDFANGVYKWVPKHNDTEATQYTKATNNPKVPLLTLFRCTMRTKAKWWFISQADLEKPGTDKDIDYYLHRSTADEEREPPSGGWTRVSPGVTLLGKDPPPVLKRGELILPRGATKEMYLDHKLLVWCSEKHLLRNAFESSIHREIVARSGKFLTFLADYDQLTAEHIHLVWKAAMHSQENDIIDEIFSLLVPLSKFLNDTLFGELMELASQALRQEDGLGKIAQFVEKFTYENFKHVNGVLDEKAAMKLLSLVWEVYRNPGFESLKNGQAIQDLLSYCFNLKGGVEMVTQRILECREMLVQYADEASITVPGAYSRGGAGVHHSPKSNSVKEEVIARVMQILHFLISKHTTGESVIQLCVDQFPEALLAEVHRYVLLNRDKLDLGQISEFQFSTQLSLRLQVLRRFYSINNEVTIPLTSIRTLSELLSKNACETDEFFQFLKSSSSFQPQQQGVLPQADDFISIVDTLQIFKEFICSPSIDWSHCREGAFECFSNYFTELENAYNQFPVGTELPPKLGLDTLWRIALNISAPAITNNAIDLLLQAYDVMLYREGDAYKSMLSIIFGHLQAALRNVESNGSKGLLKDRDTISRCVSILSSALTKSKGQPLQAHAIRGCMYRMRVSVYYRKVTCYYNPSTQSEVVRVEKGSDGLVKIDIHPLHTVKDLKNKIHEAASLGSLASSISLDSIGDRPVDTTIIQDTTRLAELNLRDGGDIYVSYQISYTKSFEDDSFSRGGTEHVEHVGNLLANDYSQFDCLLSLCEAIGDQDIANKIWEVVMLLPTQMDLMLQSVEQICFPESSSPDVPLTPGKSNSNWNQILQNSSLTRTTYLLQIIDNLLQPAPEMNEEDTVRKSLVFKEAFVSTGGFSMVLKILITTPTGDGVINSTALAVALHIIHFLLYGEVVVPVADVSTEDVDLSLISTETEDLAAQSVALAENRLLQSQIESCSGQLIEKLLYVARNAAEKEESEVVQNSLVIINNLIRSPDAASQLTSNAQAKMFLATVLRSGAKKVREMASEFAVQVGRTQPVVFQWLLEQLRDMNPKDDNCSEVFVAFSTLLCDLEMKAKVSGESSGSNLTNFRELASILSTKLMTYPRIKLPIQEERIVLLGCLDMLDNLLRINADAVLATPLGANLVHSFLSEFLFAMPKEDGVDVDPICDTPATRQAAFNVVDSFLKLSGQAFEEVLSDLSKLSKNAASYMYSCWGLQVSHDVKKPDMLFSGLKNQGCTCYMNSLLQVLFMSSAFRDAILSTPLLETHRTTLWHRTNVELVGQTILFEWASGAWRAGQIVGFDASTSAHRVQYHNADGSLDELAIFNIHEGRFQRETGRVRILPEQEIKDIEPLTERDEMAYRVLEQLQRTFCFMKLSKRRYFDPRPFVEACRTLNLNFNVYHQNDAAEFCDQLLDRIETATKGKHTKRNIWNDVLMNNMFGGQWLYQKIPQDCDVYNTDKTGCGHWQSSRNESYLKVELMIRGKDKIEDSLEELMVGELMDGENKIHCDVCTEKKATVRRTCFGKLPSTLILHLKRFDLDFQTFETVKLNNRMAFPSRINMLKYTKEGIEAEERRRQQESRESEAAEGEDSTLSSPTRGNRSGAGRDIQYEPTPVESDLDPEDYEYELEGVLVHAGVAQGGHYYSYIKDTESQDCWYKFEDEDVSPFNPENIPAQCFGGPFGGSSSSSMADEDRTSNALMVVYSKVKKNPAKKEEEGDSPDGLRLVDGMKAFRREVQESNLQHILSCYLLDADLHAFVRGLLTSVVKGKKKSTSEETPSFRKSQELQWSPTEMNDDLPLRTVQFSINFLLDVVLHCRERAAIRSTVDILREAFEVYPHTAVWFITQLLDTSNCSWFNCYMLQCTDALARATFVQVLVQAVTVVAPKDTFALTPFKSLKSAEVRAESAKGSHAAMTVILVRLLMDHVFKAVNFVRTSDELFVLMRDLAGISCIRYALQSIGAVSFLCYFVMPEQVPQMVRVMFEKHLSPSRQNTRAEYGNLLQSVFEAMAAVLGVPQLRKVNLLQERSYWETELVPDAREALTIVFKESSRMGGMDAHDIGAYFDRVHGTNTGTATGHKMTPLQIRSLLDRFPTNPDGKLSLEGFLQYHADTASYNPKHVWRDLHAFGFRNDLSRAAQTVEVTSASAEESEENKEETEEVAPLEAVEEAEELRITDNCRACLSNIALYEIGLAASEASTKAVARRVCLRDPGMTTLITQALAKLFAISCENTWNHHPVSVINDFLKLLFAIDDGFQIQRLHEMLLSPKYGLAVVALTEKNRPTNCRANEFNKYFLYERYLGFVQDLVPLPKFVECLTALAQTEPVARTIKGMLRLIPGYMLTENEDLIVRNTKIVVDGAGVPEVNGEYMFKDIKNNAGYYHRMGVYAGNEVHFTLYKCSLRNGGYQWFLSITPEKMEPGTHHDIDFYYSSAKNPDKLPSQHWYRMNTNHSKDPSPKVQCVRVQGVGSSDPASSSSVNRVNISMGTEGSNAAGGESSDSDKDSGYMMVGDDSDIREIYE